MRAASNGVLEIDDGGETKRVELDRANLSSGSMVYRNVSDKVRFRLVVYLDSGLSVTEELRLAALIFRAVAFLRQTR